MKYYIILLCFFCAIPHYSQNKTLSNKLDEFDQYAKPNENNLLSTYFKKKLDANLVQALNFKDTLENNKRVFLTFKFSKDNKIVNIKAKSDYSELNAAIEEAFEKFDTEKLIIPEIDRRNIYVIQIISRKGNENIINCNSEIVYDRYPVFEGCESIENYGQMNGCINKQLEAYVAKNINPETIKDAKILGEMKLNPKFEVNKEGGIEHIACKAPTANLTKEIKKIIAEFPKAKIPAMRNGQPTTFNINCLVSLQIDTKDEKYEKEVLKSNDSILNPNNELALHFKNLINEDELQKIVFPIIEKKIYLYFARNKKGKLIDIKSNSISKDYNERLVAVFKKFPVEKLNITNPNKLDYYRFTIMTKVHKKVIECEDKPDVFNFPLFDKSCEKSDSALEVRTCLSESIAHIIRTEFNTNLNPKTNLTGQIRILTRFEINTLGEFINVKVSAPNPYLENELIHIIKQMPKVYKPAYLNNKPFLTKWAIPVVFSVGDNKTEDLFKGMQKNH